uniref:Uncharacterized protein n=1 Tax=Haptolina ericina TaxID=156174 RepID=A0A7S3F9B7_9EUKA|mmetsp:Transcript_59856/g.133393  ORF Transcript_59856/g.133393 Transcript_59856/m.133393 type:complete len:218 (+) Transcript_59856:647-1300(+)
MAPTSFCFKLAAVLASDTRLAAQPIALRALQHAGIVEAAAGGSTLSSADLPELLKLLSRRDLVGGFSLRRMKRNASEDSLSGEDETVDLPNTGRQGFVERIPLCYEKGVEPRVEPRVEPSCKPRLESRVGTKVSPRHVDFDAAAVALGAASDLLSSMCSATDLARSRGRDLTDREARFAAELVDNAALLVDSTALQPIATHCTSCHRNAHCNAHYIG